MPDDYTMCDDILFHVLKECQTLPAFLDSVFGFLKRRTDFYIVADDPSSAVGLPSSVAENVVKQTFYKWQMHEIFSNLSVSEQSVPAAIQEVEIVSPDIVECSTTVEEDEDIHESQQIEEVLQIQEIKEIQQVKEQQQIQQLPTKSQTKASPECFNGAATENYMWSQGIQDVDITLQLQKGVNPKQLKVIFQKHRLLVRDKIKQVDLLSGELLHAIRYTEVSWSVDVKACRMEIHMDKLHEHWWDRLFADDPPLDVQTLDCSRPFEELSEQAQAQIAQVQYNHERQQAGLPTVEQERMEVTLRKAWNAEGSPFSGPFDISKVIMEPQLMNVQN